MTVASAGLLLPVLAYDFNDVYLAFNGLTRQAVQTSFQNQADGRFGELVTYQVLASVLDGFNEQINCSNCVSAFGSVGSLSAGVHGRYANTTIWRCSAARPSPNITAAKSMSPVRLCS